ncbi:hypothetical protein [Diaphorobacter caeni]|uniref:hypothetical protein n=1 Tax=Diaphorobacter caeni TaxID=2784387 RepID=UPI00188DDB39|nr:hypothetical protein [Diaphorobacter caeni]MBF5003274.1 hypothetical protein [Diaphorobacter caeni]
MSSAQADSAKHAAGPHWARSVGAAALWTLAQHGAFFACAWWVSWWAGAERFGAFGQGLALSAMLSAAITFRLEYAGQLERRQRRAASLFSLAQRSAWLICALLLAALAVVHHQWVRVPLWLWASTLALAPQAATLVLASRCARGGDVVRAAALRSGPAIIMVLILLPAWAVGWQEGIEWSIPLSAWMGWMVARLLSLANNPGGDDRRRVDARRVAAFHLPFVRAELPGFLLNVSANHGQVLLIGAMGGDAAAGTAALALRIAMLPTSLFGLALADRLRSRVVAQGIGSGLTALLRQAVQRMMALSLGAHVIAALLVPLLLPLVFPQQGEVLVSMVMWLLPLGMVRLVASPLAFMLPWRGWLGLSLLGQCLLFACALLSVVLVFPISGLNGVAVAYAISAVGVYLGYIATAWAAARTDT